MSIEKINLRKLLQFFGADARLQRSMLLEDIRKERSKKIVVEEGKKKGGDFYGAFWADVKTHAAGGTDISSSVEFRISRSKQRSRLYPSLRDGFLEMWNEKIRWRNEPFQFVPKSIHSQLTFEELGLTVKIENTAGIVAFDGSHRVMYPYFYEEPPLSIPDAQLGFWILQKALPDYPLESFRIIDFIRRNYIRPTDIGMAGDEEARFYKKYRALSSARDALERRKK